LSDRALLAYLKDEPSAGRIEAAWLENRVVIGKTPDTVDRSRVPPDTAHKWTCSVCGVAASRSDAEEGPLPEFWESGADGTFCLGCRRQRAAEAAVDSAPAITDRGDRERLRRAAVVEFELTRTPDRPNGSIANACRSSIPVVAAARRRLEM
jgi:hypothetical protein